MNEIYIINELSGGAAYGIGKYLEEYIYCLKRLNFKICLCELNSEKDYFDVVEEDGIIKMFFPYSTYGQVDIYYLEVCRIIRLYVADHIHLWFHFHYSHLSILAQEIKKHFPHAKSVLTIHYLPWTWTLSGDEYLFKQILAKKDLQTNNESHRKILDYHNQFQLMLSLVDAVITLSTETYQLIREYYCDRDKVFFIPNGLRELEKSLTLSAKQKIRHKYHILPEDKVLLFVGRLDLMKGIYNLIHSYEESLNSLNSSKLFVVGSPSSFREVMQHCKYVGSKIILTGKLKYEEVLELYEVADIGLLPSYSEECSYTAIEMMRCGLPVITSDGRGLKTMFQDGMNAKVVTLGKREKNKAFEKRLKEAILNLIRDERLRKELGIEARKTFKEKYNIERMLNSYKIFFKSIDSDKCYEDKCINAVS